MSPGLERHIAAYGLPGHTAAFPDQPLADTEWQALLRVVDEQRLAGLLHWAVDDGAFPVDDEQRQAVADLHLRWCAAALSLERRLLELDAAFGSASIDFLVLKGTAVAHLVYPDPALRLFGDVDLLFPAERFEQALEVARDLGYVRPAEEARPGFDRRFGKGATLKGPTGNELDAHRTLVFGTFGFAIDLDELFRSATAFELGGRKLRALGPETRLLHACYHASLGDSRPRYSSVRDIAQMLTTGTHDPDRVLALAREWQAQAVLARAFALCRDFLGVAVDGPLVEALNGYRPTRREQRAIDSYTGPNRRFAHKVFASLPYLHGMRDRAAFVGAMVLPSRGFAESYGGRAGLAWIRRGLRSIRAAGGRR